ncbi:uncharacterized protein LOC134273467 [Saccostrea cucullata]|uniref:uncharacterized protein LOC134273467 n=1 Tax=Saccostrea cuccullata TaxID=36930 RepID=UPI002ED37EE2
MANKEEIMTESTKNTTYDAILSSTCNKMEQINNMRGEIDDRMNISQYHTNKRQSQQLNGEPADFELEESMFSALMEDPSLDFMELHHVPLSDELPHEITHTDVDALIGDVTQIDSKFNSSQQINGQFASSSMNHGDDGNYVNPQESEPSIASDLQEMEVRRKDKLKKDNHNIIERRRRYHINDRIKELASLLPTSTPQSMKLHKGSILKASVEYLKDLKKDKEKLARCEARQKEMEAKYQKILIREFQIELKMRLHGLSVELDFKRGMEKKKTKKSFDKVDEIVENLIEQSMQLTSENICFSTSSSSKVQEKSKKYNNNKNIEHPRAKAVLEKFITKKLNKKTISDCQSNFVKEKSKQNQLKLSSEQGSAENTNDLTLPQRDKLEIPKQGQMFPVQNRMVAESLPLFSFSNELSIKQCDIFSGSPQKPEYQCCSIKPSQFFSCPHLSTTEKSECTSSIKVTSSMLKTLLRKSEKTISPASLSEMSLEK